MAIIKDLGLYLKKKLQINLLKISDKKSDTKYKESYINSKRRRSSNDTDELNKSMISKAPKAKGIN